jgi:uncharacterized protein YbaP (TraB family)
MSMRMRRAWHALAMAWLLLWAGLATAAGPLFLWELRDAGGGLRAWLYGTIHVCDAACFPLPGKVREALGAADSLALELDLADPAVMQRLGEAALLPAGTRLDAQLPPALRPRLVLASTRMGLPPEAVQRLQPWMVGTLLTVRVAETVGFRTEQGVDLWLAGAARAAGKPLWALETVDRQIAALSAGGEAAQMASLTEVIELIESGDARAYFQRMLDAWQAGDVAALDRCCGRNSPARRWRPCLRRCSTAATGRWPTPSSASWKAAAGPSWRWAPAISAGPRACWRSWPGGAIN